MALFRPRAMSDFESVMRSKADTPRLLILYGLGSSTFDAL